MAETKLSFNILILKTCTGLLNFSVNGGSNLCHLALQSSYLLTALSRQTKLLSASHGCQQSTFIAYVI